MQTVYFVDVCSAGKSNGITTYTSHYLQGMESQKNFKVICIWLNAVRTVPSPSFAKFRAEHIFIPKFKANEFPTKNEHQWLADLLFGIIDSIAPIIHLNWISHCEILKYLKWRLNFTSVLTKHCIPWRDSISTDYSRFNKINLAFRSGLPFSSLDTSLLEESSSYQNIDKIVTVTQQAKNNLVTLFSINKSKVVVVRNGMNLGHISTSCKLGKEELKTKYGFPATSKIILFVGTISIRKGVCDLVESFKRLCELNPGQDYRLVFVGSGDYSLIFKYPNLVSKITLTGNLTKGMVTDFYKLADLGVIPSYVEQCSYTAIEMMLSKLPIVAANVDGLKEIIKRNCGLHVDLKVLNSGNVGLDCNQLRKKMQIALSDNLAAVHRAENAYQYAIEAFPAKKMITKLLKVYSSVKSIQKTFPTNYPKISILLPVYNCERHLSECINSILNQTYENFELIIVNDGSTDSSGEIIKGFNDPRIRSFNNKCNKGITSALNRGITYCSGKYIARLDADDIMLPNRLHEQTLFLEKNQDYAMVGSWYHVINEHGRIIKTAKPLVADTDLKILLLFNNQFAHSTVTIRADILKNYRYRNKYRFCEDFDLWLRISKRDKVANLPMVLSEYRSHSDSLSILNSHKQFENTIELIVDNLEYLSIPFTPQELTIHAAVTRRIGTKFFTILGNYLALSNWVDKILLSQGTYQSTDKKMELKNYIISLASSN